jgi:hypothetical protein
MEQQRDRNGRRNRLKPISTGKCIRPQARDLLWFSMLAAHGPLPSSFLLEYAKHTHRSEKRARERLTDLFNEDNTPHAGRYLVRPPQQFRTIDSRYNQLVHDLAPAGLAALKKQSLRVRQAHSGPWLHSFMVSCITASIELACLERDDVAYIPQSAILARANADLRWPAKIADPKTGARFTKDLLPDAVFGLEYLTDQGSRFRFFAVEADRATEPATSSNFHRKSFERHLLQYQVLNVTSDAGRMERMLKVTGELFPHGNSYQLFQVWKDFGPVFRPPAPNPALLMGDWARAGFADEVTRSSSTFSIVKVRPRAAARCPEP